MKEKVRSNKKNYSKGRVCVSYRLFSICLGAEGDQALNTISPQFKESADATPPSFRENVDAFKQAPLIRSSSIFLSLLLT